MAQDHRACELAALQLGARFVLTSLPLKVGLKFLLLASGKRVMRVSSLLLRFVMRLYHVEQMLRQVFDK